MQHSTTIEALYLQNRHLHATFRHAPGTRLKAMPYDNDFVTMNALGIIFATFKSIVDDFDDIVAVWHSLYKTGIPPQSRH